VAVVGLAPVNILQLSSRDANRTISMRLDVILAFGFIEDLFMDCYKGG